MPARDDSVDFVNRVLSGDDFAVVELLQAVTGRVVTYLRNRFGTLLTREDVEELLSTAAYKIWLSVRQGSYDSAKCSIHGWFLVIIDKAAIDLLRSRENKIRFCDQQFALRLVSEDPPSAEDANPVVQLLIEDLYAAIKLLPRMQQHIIVADLAEGGRADGVALSKILDTSTRSINQLRRVARKRLRKELEKRGHMDAFRKVAS